MITERSLKSSEKNKQSLANEVGNFKKILTGTSAVLFLATWIGVSQLSHKSECVGKVEWENPDRSLALCSDASGHVIVSTPDTTYTLPEGVRRVTQTIYNVKRNKLYYYRDINESSFEVNYLDLETGLYGEPIIL